MKLSAAFSLFSDSKAGLGVALDPLFGMFFCQPSLILRLSLLSRAFMAHVWVDFATGTDEAGRPVKEKLLPKMLSAQCLLSVQLGHGHIVKYLDRNSVFKDIALEPNTLMHLHIRAIANSAGFVESDGSLAILSCCAENTLTIISQMGGQPFPIDTIIAILTLCSIFLLEQTLHALVETYSNREGNCFFMSTFSALVLTLPGGSAFGHPSGESLLTGVGLTAQVIDLPNA